MKKLVVAAMIAALAVPVMAAESTWIETQTGVIGRYLLSNVNASLTLEIGYADGTPIGDVDYFAQNWYNDSDSQIAHLFLESNQDINVTMSWSGVPGWWAPSFGVDFLVWDGEGQGSPQALYEWELYGSTSSAGSKSFVLNYDGSNLLVLDDGQWWTRSNLGVEHNFFDIFGQANQSGNSENKLGIGARLDFSPAVTPIPAPGAILLAGIGTSLVGWLRRRRSL